MHKLKKKDKFLRIKQKFFEEILEQITVITYIYQRNFKYGFVYPGINGFYFLSKKFVTRLDNTHQYHQGASIDSRAACCLCPFVRDRKNTRQRGNKKLARKMQHI